MKKLVAEPTIAIPSSTAPSVNGSSFQRANRNDPTLVPITIAAKVEGARRGGERGHEEHRQGVGALLVRAKVVHGALRPLVDEGARPRPQVGEVTGDDPVEDVGARVPHPGGGRDQSHSGNRDILVTGGAETPA